jgi:hypothetical protein
MDKRNLSLLCAYERTQSGQHEHGYRAVVLRVRDVKTDCEGEENLVVRRACEWHVGKKRASPLFL